jgi:hypothetical protein
MEKSPNRVLKTRIKPMSYTPPELRFPKRLQKVTIAGVEIARSLGHFGDNVGHGRIFIARFEDFHIMHFTPCNQPTAWPGIDWDDKIRLNLSGLLISYGINSCLDILWDNKQQYVRWFRNPSTDNWDRRLRQLWTEKGRSVRAELLRRFE